MDVITLRSMAGLAAGGNMKARWLVVLLIAATACVVMIGRYKERLFTSSDPSKAQTGIQMPAAVRPTRPTGTQTRPADLVAAIEEAIASGNGAELKSSFQALLAGLVELDPAAAAALLARIEPGPIRDEYLLRLAQLWAVRDWKAALEWASALEDQTERGNAQRSVCVEMAQANPEAGVLTLEKLELPDDQSTLANLAQSWAEKDQSAARAWALGKPEGEQRDRLLARVAYAGAAENPVEAARLVVSDIAPGDVQTEAAMSIVHRWALQDWASAEQWVKVFPEGPLRERAQQELAGIQAYAEAQRSRTAR